MVKILLLAVIISLAFSSNFEPRTKDQVSQGILFSSKHSRSTILMEMIFYL